jgi:hypothetical protein
MELRKFLSQIPFLCEAKNAARWSRLIELQYDDELENENSVFALNEDDMLEPSNRMETAFGFSGNIEKNNHCKTIVELLMLLHYKNNHNVAVYDNRIKELMFFIEETEKNYPEIYTMAPSSELSAMSWWDGE